MWQGYASSEVQALRSGYHVVGLCRLSFHALLAGMHQCWQAGVADDWLLQIYWAVYSCTLSKGSRAVPHGPLFHRLMHMAPYL